MLTTKPRGTNDFLPGEVEKWQYLEKLIREQFANYHYKEIRTPIFEHTELFLRSVGETSDIVSKEMYSFEDKGLRHVTLRPEGTAGVVRAFVENKLFAQSLPAKLYYIGPMFRYDQPQAGRYRQFHQLGCEVLGSAEPIVDAEVITFAVDLFSKLGLQSLSVLINTVGCDHCRPRYQQALKDYFSQYQDQLCPTCLERLEKNPLRLLDCKEEGCKAVAAGAPTTLDYACDDCKSHFEKVCAYLESVGIQYEVDTTLVRGLDYYTQTAFEVIMNKVGSQQNAICGGGRYNKLVSQIGGDDVPGVGFAAGMERVLLTVAEEGIELPVDTAIDVYVAPLGDAAKEVCFKLTHALRQKGLKVETDYLSKSMKAQMKAADKNHARYTIIVGDDELAQGVCVVRDMAQSTQENVALDNVLDFIK
ncbi:MAG: histidine--tRNA ligase [Peptococcaceae bacterium]|nr:histidine--tRNA ligase [Peptococcaceae bacterium]